MARAGTLGRVKNFLGIVWILVMAANAFAGFLLITVVAASKGAPQEAAGAAIACAISVGSYVFARAIEGVGRAYVE